MAKELAFTSPWIEVKDRQGQEPHIIAFAGTTPLMSRQVTPMARRGPVPSDRPNPAEFGLR